MVMAADTGCTDLTLRTEEGVSPATQELKHVEARLGTLSDNLNLCNQVLSDLEALSDVLVRKSLQDVSLPPRK